jgi:hypothetical protein
MATPLPPGHFRLVPYVAPPLPAGSYLLTGAVTGMPGTVEPLRSRVEIEAPRYVMPPDQILSTFPPAGARGSFTSRLPQIVLRRRTLPWERSDDLDNAPTKAPTPWLALVLVAEGEGQLLTDVPVADCTTAGVDLGADADVPKGACLEVPRAVVDKVFPTVEDLALLCHVREVDLADTELALGDDDGWLAVVMGNRLPQPGVRYLACLVNLESQHHELPVVPEFEIVTSYVPIDRVVDLRATYTQPEVPMDAAVMHLPLAGATFATDDARRGDGGDAFEVAASAAHVTGASGPAAVTGAGWAAATEGPSFHVAADSGRKAKLALADGFTLGPLPVATLRFPVLAYWSFTCEERGDFQYLATNVHVRMLGHVVDGAETPDGDPIGPDQPVTPANAAQPGVTRPLPLVAETGHVLLDHVSRRGEAAPAWFRGPLTPAAVPRAEAPEPEPGEPPLPPPLAHHADQLRRVVPDGHEDLGYAAGFEIGRLLALSQPGVVAALARWRQEAFGAARVTTVVADATKDLPGRVRDALATPDPFASDLSAGVRAHTAGARALRALVDTLGDNPAAALGPTRPVADAGAAARHLGKALSGGTPAVAAAFGIAVDGGGPDGLLRTVEAAPVQVLAATDGAVEAAALRARLEAEVAAVAADAASRDRRGATFDERLRDAAERRTR